MALIKCPECGNTISSRATTCPRCGNPISIDPQATGRKRNHVKIVLYAIIGILILAIIGLAVSIYLQQRHVPRTVKHEQDYTERSRDAHTDEADDEGSSFSITQVDSYNASDTPHDFFCYSEDLDYDDNDRAKSFTVDGCNASITRAWLEHNDDGCIKVHFNMNTTGLRGKQLNVACLFWFDDGRQINSTDGRFETAGRQVCTRGIVTPQHQKCDMTDISLAIPYSQIKRVADWKHLKCRIEVSYNGQRLATSKFMHFGCWLE